MVEQAARRRSEPARVVGPEAVDTAGDEPGGVPAVGVHHPNRGRAPRLRPAEGNVPAVRGLARAEVPDRRAAARECGDPPVARVEPADLGAANAAKGMIRIANESKQTVNTLRLPGVGSGDKCIQLLTSSRVDSYLVTLF